MLIIMLEGKTVLPKLIDRFVSSLILRLDFTPIGSARSASSKPALLLAVSILSVLALPLGLSGTAQAQKRPAVADSPDDTFIQLREASRANDYAKASLLAARLGDYPIRAYVEYFQIKPRMFDSTGLPRTDAPDAEIASFIRKYDGEAIADRMRNDYLLVLGKRRDWTQFDAIYPQFVLKDDAQVNCYAMVSRGLREVNDGPDKNEKNELQRQAARLLLEDSKNGVGDGCSLLADTYFSLGRLKPADIWDLVRIAYDANYLTVGKRLARLVLDNNQEAQLEADSDSIAGIVSGNKNDNEMAALSIVKLARTDPAKAADLMDNMPLTARSKGALWGIVAMNAAKKLLPEAAGYYRKVGDVKLWDEAYQWQVRAALRAGDWKQVRHAAERMSAEARKDPTWTYWLGRAYKQEGRKEDAFEQWHRIAEQYNFYGQLANEELGRAIPLPPQATPNTEAELAEAEQNPAFQRAAKFYDLNLRFEGNREWNWPLRNMSDRQLLAAATYAKKIGLLDRTVNTADRTREEHDFSLRYLTPYRDVVKRQSNAIGLDEAWAYGIMRQESRFITVARSNVGASGLMQVMPATGRFVAKKIGLIGFDATQLSDINVNVQIGTNYLKMVSDDLQGSQTLASAAYNAGPGRPRQWRSTLQKAVEGAIFAESIPFNETRNYVKNVLANATYYAMLFDGQVSSLKSRLGTVRPADFLPSDLP